MLTSFSNDIGVLSIEIDVSTVDTFEFTDFFFSREIESIFKNCVHVWSVTWINVAHQ